MTDRPFLVPLVVVGLLAGVIAVGVAHAQGRAAAPYVSLAESVALEKQDRAEFESLLKKALAIDADAWPEIRLANLIAQRRARWLLERMDELFLAVPKENSK